VYRLARSGYQPSLFQGRLTVFRASRAASGDSNDTPAFEQCHDERLGWEARASRGVDTIAVAGGHVSMLAEPHVTSLAEQLSAAIAKSST
jgi:thioesterase domain-containing protein